MDETHTTGALLTVAQLAERSGVTVRTLHHYDSIGLLTPLARSEAEYRLYGAAQLERLRAILVWRRLGMSLAEIGALLDDPATDRRAVLTRQRALVGARQAELAELASALDRALDREHDHDTTGARMAADEEIIAALGGFDPREHEDETKERWGDREEYGDSARRTSTYTPADWRAIRLEADGIHRALVLLWESGADPAGAAAIEQAEAWRAHVSRWYYECAPELLRGLGDMYVTDPRFAAYYEGAAGERAGLAAWVRDAWIARADAG
ncbi:MAG: MerR family transcriptional regulator [Thermoleophilia bacterium]|nr:MerR family transcriptional regulator [Thermoleophilia bacterium]